MSIRIEEFWQSSYRKKFRASYRFTRKDGVLLNRMLKDFRSERFVCWAIERFFDRADDPYAKMMGHSVATLNSRIQAYWNEWSQAHAVEEHDRVAKQMEMMPTKIIQLADRIGR